MRNKKVLVFYNPEKKEAKSILKRLEGILKRKKIKYVFLPSDKDTREKGSIALALGGDGTILKVAQKLVYKKIPLFGINLGTLGFLAEADSNELDRCLDLVMRGKIRVQERMMLDIKIMRNGSFLNPSVKYIALNDCVIKSCVEARVISVSAYVNRHFLATYVGDGVIVSTPTGSTAYSLAAQGPIVYPEIDLFVLTPICPHTLMQRPIIIDDDSEIELRIDPSDRARSINLSLDGQIDIILRYGDRIFVKKAKNKFLLATMPDRDYFSILREKLNWGK